ncbi:MAG: hypothetical protein JWL99_3759, partial [Streptomyces oryziradicis]|nr:hypothetical protein [Actinacidiphila oryziradicis]
MVRTPRQESGESSKAAGDSPAHGRLRAERTVDKDGSAPAAASLAATSATALNPQALLALQRSAGNAAATRAMRRGPSAGRAVGPGPAPVQRAPGSALDTVFEEADRTADQAADPDAIEQIDAYGNPIRASRPGGAGRTGRRARPAAPPGRPRRGPSATEAGVGPPPHVPLGLPPYLRELRSAGLSTVSKLTKHEFVYNRLCERIGRSDGTVAEIRDELAGRPETFYGGGRAFAVQGPNGWYDVTVSIGRGRGDTPMSFPGAGAPETAAMAPAAAAVAEGAKTKVDHLRSSAGSVTHDSSSSRGFGASASGTFLAPTPAPVVWAGVTLAAGGGIHSSTDTHTTKTTAEPRVLRSAGGTVEVPRKVRYNVRVKHHGTAGAAEAFSGSGTLTMRVPHEHLVPATAARTPDHGEKLHAQVAREVRLATSMAPLAVEDTGAPHAGGQGLFDTVGSVLHPSLTSPGSAGRARLYEATSTATVLEDLPRLLAGWVSSEDLGSKDGSAQGAYRMRAEIVSMTPAWGIGGTQLRTHQQTQDGRGDTSQKGFGGSFGAGPALGLGAPVPVARLTQMTQVDARRTRFSSSDQTVSTRQGAEIRGEKVLYRSQVRLTVQGTGPSSPGMRLRPGKRTARHPLDVWITMRAQEAESLGLPLPDGDTAGKLYSKTEKNADGTEKLNEDGTPKELDRHLPFGAMGSSVALNHLDA